ncbi:hypothetical protein M768_13835 [Cellulosimicrobium cellulans F16]|uniref:Uncharacterized protein n=1 Tax=Cellulosimicrobium cellulans F16 TaxID=1350482 RepID=A0A0M0F515_CELCE|nr:hypothetical protein [Cellulosimicrobium cellulans]KON72583.1 hypothetical protein M768_13835 [Cellulosimicrobium cellulans F16]
MTHHPDWFVQYDRILNTETLVTAIATHLGITTPDVGTASTPEAEALASVPVNARGDELPSAPAGALVGVEIACAWSDYQKDHGVSGDETAREREHAAFVAGWQAARGTPDARGPLR